MPTPILSRSISIVKQCSSYRSGSMVSLRSFSQTPKIESNTVLRFDPWFLGICAAALPAGHSVSRWVWKDRLEKIRDRTNKLLSDEPF